MKHLALANTLCLAAHKVVSTLSGFKKPVQAIMSTRDGALASMLNADLSVAKVDRVSDRAVGHAGRARVAHADPAIDLSGAGTFRNQAKTSGDFA